MADGNSPSLSDVLSSVKGIKNAIAAGEPLSAWEQTIPLQQFAIESGRTLGFKSTAGDAAVKSEIANELKECESLCSTTASVGSDPKSKIGDGAILKLVLQLVTTLLPMFL